MSLITCMQSASIIINPLLLGLIPAQRLRSNSHLPHHTPNRLLLPLLLFHINLHSFISALSLPSTLLYFLAIPSIVFPPLVAPPTLQRLSVVDLIPNECPNLPCNLPPHLPPLLYQLLQVFQSLSLLPTFNDFQSALCYLQLPLQRLDRRRKPDAADRRTGQHVLADGTIRHSRRRGYSQRRLELPCRPLRHAKLCALLRVSFLLDFLPYPLELLVTSLLHLRSVFRLLLVLFERKTWLTANDYRASERLLQFGQLPPLSLC
ncbi:hypothetical protein NEOLEDRAFT_182972 [Neolentinus lepideus HHB14362 ss-1]|uniref:Uncharacterized protein n=1 Tax=Neolentinus lepideus HHB14362 ss-1 TaxID=1314782 RepID=A0A165TNX7_9AGAM|nr:hypothetical protein NEOLEDRAFT_182972 [Neolentinus lepideus HHB14362 ss-1]